MSALYSNWLVENFIGNHVKKEKAFLVNISPDVVYVCVCVCVLTCKHACVLACACACMWVCMHACMHTSICACMCVYSVHNIYHYKHCKFLVWCHYSHVLAPLMYEELLTVMSVEISKLLLWTWNDDRFSFLTTLVDNNLCDVSSRCSRVNEAKGPQYSYILMSSMP